MTHPWFTGGGWKTDRMIRAEIELDDAVRQVDADLARAAELDFTDPPLSDEDVARFEQAARDEHAPQQLRRLAERVDRGELTWRDITEGKAIRDPTVRAAFAEAGKQVDASPLARIAEQLSEGMTAEEIVEAAAAARAHGPATETSEQPPTPPQATRQPQAIVSDDDYFSNMRITIRPEDDR